MKLSIIFATATYAATALEIVLGSEVHKTLAKLAGTLPEIVDVLKSQGPLTLFAPTDDAFNKLDEATLKAVTSDSKLLATVLKYHVVAGTAFEPAGVQAKSFLETASGETVIVNVADGNVGLEFGLGKSKVSSSAKADNGIVHIVDTVLVPPPSASKTAVAAGLDKLVEALKSTSLVETVDGANEITIFAPSNEAFEKFTKYATDNKLEVTTELLASVLKLHVVPSVIYSTDIVKAKSVKVEALSKSSLTAELKDGAVLVVGEGNSEPAKVITADVIFDKGVVHVIDTVLLPNLKSTPSPDVSTITSSSRSPSYSGVGTAMMMVLAMLI